VENEVRSSVKASMIELRWSFNQILREAVPQFRFRYHQDL